MEKVDRMEDGGGDFNAALETTELMPNPENSISMENREMPMSGNPFFDYNPIALGAQEWERVVADNGEKAFNGSNPAAMMMNLQGLMMDQMRLHADCCATDQPRGNELCVIAERVIREMYNIGDEISFEFEVTMAHEASCSDECEPEEKAEIIEELAAHVYKRQVINSITHGSSVYLWERLFFLAQEELDAIDPALIPMYQEYGRTVNLGNWYIGQSMIDMQAAMAGGDGEASGMINPSIVDIEKEGNGYKIIVKAPNLPLILHEASKGVLEVISYWGLPQVNNKLTDVDIQFVPPTERDLTTEELEKVLKLADEYSHERWYYYMGPSIWSRLFEAWKITPIEAMEKLSELYQLPPNEFQTKVRELVYHLEE